MKLTESDKREIVRLRFEENCSISRIAKKYAVNESSIKRFLSKYKIHGEVAIVKGSNRIFSPEDKMQILTEYFDGASKNSLAQKYKINDSMINAWLERYGKDGYNGLIDKKKGRPSSVKKKETDKEVENNLQDTSYQAKIKILEKKNKELEAEVAYLKKLKALVQERKKLESKKK